jgi:23S rRNA pseudouridine1911/1915/1917 synthase
VNKKSNFSFAVTALDQPVRLDKWLASQSSEEFEKMTRSQIQDLIDKKKIKLNGQTIKNSSSVKNGDLVELEIPETIKTDLIAADIKLDIVYEDNDIIVVNKPAGLVVHPGLGHEHDTLVNALLFHSKNLSLKNEERPGIVHRIDKETSGLIVIAKNDAAHENLSDQFKNKTIHRIYYAIAVSKKGQLKSGRIESIIARHPGDRKKYASVRNEFSNAGKIAITHYQILEESSSMTLFKLKLETGRTHQIRVHLKEMGCNIVGDLLYGFSKQKYDQEGLKRFYLHAAELGFTHPTSGNKLIFRVPWPEDDLKIIRTWGFKFEF